LTAVSPDFLFACRMNTVDHRGHSAVTHDLSVDQWKTRHSLLDRARVRSDNEAWKEVAEIYRRFVVNLLCRFGVGVSARDDLVQEVIIKMWKGLENYDPGRARFRTWLRAVTRNTAITYFREARRNHTQTIDESRAIHRLESLSDSDLDLMIEDEWKAHITMLALQRVRGVFSGKAIDVFLLSMEGVEVEEIAHLQRLSTNSVYTLRNRVKTRMIREVRQLIQKLEF
jgi:RNA polymerase sigma factor (sigma-70 family)